jgi:hypothetical protein
MTYCKSGNFREGLISEHGTGTKIINSHQGRTHPPPNAKGPLLHAKGPLLCDRGKKG